MDATRAHEEEDVIDLGDKLPGDAVEPIPAGAPRAAKEIADRVNDAEAMPARNVEVLAVEPLPATASNPLPADRSKEVRAPRPELREPLPAALPAGIKHRVDAAEWKRRVEALGGVLAAAEAGLCDGKEACVEAVRCSLGKLEAVSCVRCGAALKEQTAVVRAKAVAWLAGEGTKS